MQEKFERNSIQKIGIFRNSRSFYANLYQADLFQLKGGGLKVIILEAI